MTYRRKLAVSFPNGEPVYATIAYAAGQANISVNYIKAIENDAPPFAKDGCIRFNVSRAMFKSAIAKLTSYIESVFLCEMSKEDKTDDSIFASLGIERKSRGTKRQDKRGDDESIKGKGCSTGVRDST